MLNELIPIRLSHLLGHSGVGAIVRGANGLVVVQDTRQWTDRQGISAGKLIPYVERVRAAMGIEEQLREPPVAKELANGQVDGACVPATRFPSWMRCPACGAMYRWPWRNDQSDYAPRCNHQDCKRHPKLEQVTWVLAHPEGYLADVPWHFLAHKDALHGLREKLPASLPNIFVVGYGVVMPDVERLPDSAEWDRAVLADGRDFRQFGKWLERFIRYWRAKDTRKAATSPSQLNVLQQHLRPDFEAVVPLHASAHDVETRIARLTEDQLRLIDVVEANPRVICSGGAGTGKTMLALELAKRWGASGMKTVLACHSPWLKRYLDRNAVPGLIVSLAESIHVAAKRVGIEKFDALIVDEGQDILNMDALAQLDSCLCGGISEGRWCFFHDANNQSGLCGSYAPDAYDYLESFCPVRIPLKTNCRNSLPILQRIQVDLDADVGNSGVGDGPAVREVRVADADGAIQALEKELRGLVDGEGFNPGDIVVLSPFPFAQSWTSSLSEDLRDSISVLDDASPRNMNRHAIGFAQIVDFKGLESEVVVVVDMPRLGHSETLRSLHYVGMSRARALLSMICC